MSNGSRTMEIMRELGMSLGQPMIAVVGCGGAGNNVIDSIYWSCPGVHTVAVNTDPKGLDKISAHEKVRIGSNDEVLSCGMPEVGERCAEESSGEIRKAIEGYDIVFVVAGLGGGAGSGAAPVVCRLGREEGAVVFSVPILPFSIEGERRSIAMTTLERLQEISNIVVPLDNDKLQSICGSMNFNSVFQIIDRSIVRLIEKIYDHSSSYVSELIDEVTSGFSVPMEEIVTEEHQAIIDEMPVAVHIPLEPEFEYPSLEASDWSDLQFNFK